MAPTMRPPVHDYHQLVYPCSWPALVSGRPVCHQTCIYIYGKENKTLQVQYIYSAPPSVLCTSTWQGNLNSTSKFLLRDCTSINVLEEAVEIKVIQLHHIYVSIKKKSNPEDTHVIQMSCFGKKKKYLEVPESHGTKLLPIIGSNNSHPVQLNPKIENDLVP